MRKKDAGCHMDTVEDICSEHLFRVKPNNLGVADMIAPTRGHFLSSGV